MMLQT